MTCKTWNLLAQKYFNPLCTNRFFPDASTNSCPICVAPYTPRAVETPCSEVILPDKTKTYRLTVKTPVSVSFSYPGLSPWIDDIVNPHFAAAAAGVAFNAAWPANKISSNPTYGYTFLWNHGDSGNIWGAELIQDVNPIRKPSMILQPGTARLSGGKWVCECVTGGSYLVASARVARGTTISPPVDTEPHPHVWSKLNYETVECRVVYFLTYFVETPGWISGPDWLDPTTKYRISVSAQIDQTSSLRNGVDLVYGNLSGTSPWTYPSEFINPTAYGYGAPSRFGGSSPAATTYATYEFETTDRAAFLSATHFSLALRTANTPYTDLSAPNTASTIISRDYISSAVLREATFPGWSTIPQTDSYCPSSPCRNFHFTSGGMSSGWPSSLTLSRLEV